MPFGTHVVQYNATDPSGNTDICQFTVKVNEMPRAQCESPPQVLHGIVSCQDRETLTCGIDYCYSGYIQTNNQSYTCQKGEWTPKFSSEFQTSSCFKPEPTKLDRNYTFSFTCPKLKFSPLDLRDCIRQSGLCPSGDILLCDKPFQRIEGKHLSAEDLQIWTTLEGILPYQANKNELITRMDVHGISIANYFTNGTFKDVCHQLKCQFEKIKADPIREICGIGTVEYLMEGRKTCRKCGPGWYYDNGDCVQCSEGFYQDQFGQQTCEKCPEGTTSVIGTLIKSECYIEVIVEKQASSSSFNTLALIGIAISGLLLLVFVILVVLVNKWRMSANKKNSDDNTRRNQDSHTGCSEPQSEVYDEIKDDAVLEGYVIYKPGDTISCGVYETLPGRERVENPYTRISWRNY
ncbi:uncharacterized protein LOC134228932 [Saccostrea cucullata]|uniref:uncharacterized protein LOC134228932 n=1 Tax=Saccostrea cuccullata TaxID=36930 RepID=UPI002ED1E2D9